MLLEIKPSTILQGLTLVLGGFVVIYLAGLFGISSSILGESIGQT